MSVAKNRLESVRRKQETTNSVLLKTSVGKVLKSISRERRSFRLIAGTLRNMSVPSIEELYYSYPVVIILYCYSYVLVNKPIIFLNEQTFMISLSKNTIVDVEYLTHCENKFEGAIIIQKNEMTDSKF